MPTQEKKSYPRAIPHRSPDEIAAELTRWQRRSRWLIITAAGFLLLSLAAVAYAFTNRAPRDRRSDVPEPLMTEWQPTAPPVEAPIAAPKKPGDAAPAKKQARDSSRHVFLEATGTLCGAHLYQTYLNIGLLADGVESEAYTAEEAQETLVLVNELLDQVEGQLAKISRLPLDRDDETAIDQFRSVAVMLRIQAKLLNGYWETGELDQAKQYHETRKAAWKGIAKIMQLDAE